MAFHSAPASVSRQATTARQSSSDSGRELVCAADKFQGRGGGTQVSFRRGSALLEWGGTGGETEFAWTCEPEKPSGQRCA